MYSLTPVQIFLYIEKSFLMFSNIKDMILQRRNGSNQLQWEYILENCNIRDKERFEKGFKNANGYYKNISNDLADTAVAALVNHEIEDEKRFENTISQSGSHKGWFANCLFSVVYQHTTVTNKVINKIAFAFKLNLKQYDELFHGAENSVFLPYDLRSSITRFSLHYGKSFEENEALYEENKHLFDTPLSDDRFYDNAAMVDKMNDFFQTHKNTEDEKTLNLEFIEFLKQNGVSNKHDIKLHELRVKKLRNI